MEPPSVDDFLIKIREGIVQNQHRYNYITRRIEFVSYASTFSLLIIHAVNRLGV